MSEEARQLIGKHLIVYSAVTRDVVMGEGEVVAYDPGPSIALRSPDGSIHWHSARLPREEKEAR